MKSVRILSLASLSLLTLNLTGAVKAQTTPFTATSKVSANSATGSDAVNEGMYAPSYGISHRPSPFYLNVGGANVSGGVYDGFFAIRYDTTNIKSQLAANFGATPYDIVSISLTFFESDYALTAPGNVVFYLSNDNTTNFGYNYFDSKEEVKTDPFNSGSTVGAEEPVEIYTFNSSGAVSPAPMDYIPLLGSANGVTVQNPANPTAGADLLAAFNGANKLTIVARAQDSDIGTIAATPNVFATFNGDTYKTTLQPQLTVVAIKRVTATNPPPAPTAVTATPGNTQITLSWAGSANAVSYNVYRSTTPGGEGPTPFLTGIIGATVTDTNLTNGATYYYQVTAVNSAGESPKSSEVSATPFLAAPVLSVATVGGQIQLSWTAPVGATTYTLSRSSTAGTETSYKTGLLGTSFTDTGVTNGSTYYYTVTAVNSGGPSVPSNEVSAAKTSASPFTALSAAYGNDAASSDVLNGAMYAPHWPTPPNNGHRPSTNYLQLEGSAVLDGATPGGYDGYFALRFDTTSIKNQLAANFGGANYTVQAIYLALTENNQTFSAPGNVIFNLSNDNTTDFGYHHLSGTEEVTPDPFTSTTPSVGVEELLEVFPFTATGNATNYSVDNVPLYGSVNNVAVQNPTNAAAAADLLAAFNDASNKITVVGRAQDNAIGTIAATPNVAATWNGNAFNGHSQPQLVVVATAAAAPVTISGTATLEGVTLPHTGGIALDPITVYYFAPNSAAHNVNLAVGATGGPIATQSVAINPADGSFSFTPAKSGAYDLEFKTAKSLSALQANVDTTKNKTGLALNLLAGDSNNDNSVDSTDFGNLIGAFNTTNSAAGSGYDPTVDFNYDGSVDSTDFGLLIGEFNNVGQ